MHYLALFPNRAKSGIVLIEIVLTGDPLYRPVYIYWESVLFPGTIINETTFPNFQINIFYYSSYKITWQVDYIYKCMYVQTKKNLGKRTYFHYLSERLQCCTYVEILAFSELRNSIFFSQVGPVWVWGRNFIKHLSSG